MAYRPPGRLKRCLWGAVLAGEPSKSGLKGRGYSQECHENVKQTWYRSIAFEKIDFLIIATNSKERLNVLKKIINYSSIKFILFELFLCDFYENKFTIKMVQGIYVH